MPKLTRAGMDRRWAVLDKVHLTSEQRRLIGERNALMVSMNRALKTVDPIERKLKVEQIRQRFNSVRQELARVEARLDTIARELRGG